MRSNLFKVYAFSFFWMFLVIMPVLVPYFSSLGLTMHQVFQLQALFGLMVVLLEVPSGYVADLFGRKRSMVVGSIISACGFTYLYWAKSFETLLIFEFLAATGMSLISGADVSIIYDSLKKSDRVSGTKALSHYHFFKVFGEGSGALLGGFLAQYSFNHALIGTAVAAWVPFMIALTIVEPEYERMKRNAHRENFVEVMSHIFNSDALLRITFINYVVWSLSTFYAVWMLQKYWELNQVPLAWFGFLWATINLSSGIIGTQVHRIEGRFGSVSLMHFLAWAPIIAYFGMGLIWGWPGVALGLLFGLSRGVTQVMLTDAFNWRIPSKFRATANSIKSFFFRLGFAITGPAVGYGIDRWGMGATLISLGAFYVVLYFVLLLPLIRAVKAKTVAA